MQKEINNNFFVPMPVVLVGTKKDGRDNFMAVGWCTRVNANPAKLAISIHKSHLTNKTIRETMEFSVSIPDSSMVEVTDYCGVVSGAKTDKSELFDTFTGKLENAPMINEFPINIECRVTDIMEFESNDLFIADMVSVFAKEEILENNKPVLEKIDPMILTMPDNRYWKLDNKAGNAWKDGLELINK